MIIFVDFENTGSKALEGIEKLTESDVVYICACEGTGKFTFDEIAKMQDSRAKIKFIKVRDAGKDGTDKWIMKTATRIDDFHRICILSHDKVYDKLKMLGYDNIFRLEEDINELTEYTSRLSSNVMDEIDLIYKKYIEENTKNDLTAQIEGITEEVALTVDNIDKSDK